MSLREYLTIDYLGTIWLFEVKSHIYAYQQKLIIHCCIPDESWTGSEFIPPPAPEVYFLGEEYGETMETSEVSRTYLKLYMLITSIIHVSFYLVV